MHLCKKRHHELNEDFRMTVFFSNKSAMYALSVNISLFVKHRVNPKFHLYPRRMNE